MKLLLIIFLLLVGCSSKEESLEPIKEASGKILYDRISVESNYKNYNFMPGQEGLQPGQSPHGVYHKIYVNKTFLDSIPNSDKIAPNGSIIIKENYNLNKEFDKLTVMAKIEGYAPETNNWFWAVYSPSGEVLVEGSPTGCISCHSGMKDNDYVIVKELDR